MSRIAAVILAAGRSTRFGQDRGATKAAADLGGTPLIKRVALAALASRASPVIAVTGHAAGLVGAALADCEVQIAEAPDYAAGLSHSLRAGIAALPAESAAVLVLLADMPLITSALIDGLIAAFEAHPDACAVVPTRDGRRGNPVLLGRALFAKIAKLDGDSGARQILAEAEGVIECPVDDPSIFADVDTSEDLRQLADAHGLTTG